MAIALQPATAQTSYIPNLNIESFILPSPPTPTGKPLSVAAKRYRAPGAPIQSTDGITLLMFHGLGQHKEQWEPTLEKLFAIHSTSSRSNSNSNLPQIREAWALEWQSHGESAVLNQNSLQDDAESAPLNLWGIAIANFLKSDHVAGHRLYGVGYSSGTVGLLLSTRDFDKSPYNGIILIEPSMMDSDTWKANGEDEIQPAFDMVTNAVKHRRDAWATREAAMKFFMGRFPWNAWDPRIVALFAEHALTSGKDKDGNPCVVRSCPMIHEALAFQVNLKNTWDAVEQISKLSSGSSRVPIHVVFGETVDLMPQVIRECVVDKNKGRNVASITTIPDVGHTIMQEMPDVVATTVSDLLIKLCSPSPPVPVRSLL
ncbi:Alpha/beta-hydrolase [Favolaschia claudopus]|uniref:Alpha/beta-hydrolase n=1 Tax=Favolaschia claudopus TaxID=2862362 RepID=A0AAW0BFD0_9AGAR